MVDELVDLLARQTDAIATLEARLRALELVVAADEHRFVPIALEELEAAAEQLAALELTRMLAFDMAGIGIDASPDQLLEHASARYERASVEVLRVRLGDARVATRRLLDAHERASSVVAGASRDIRSRVEASRAFASA
ncbi:MAG: hypothetical protein ACLFRD_00935 [Nitriliruptoraceae bacterium]